MSSEKLEDFLIQWLSEYASKPDADYKWAERIFDLRWKPELKREQIGPLFHRTACLAGARVREDGFTEYNSKYIARISRELAAHLAEFATVESEAVGQGRSEPAVEPPPGAEFCLSLFLSGDKSEALIGDLNERFEQDCKRYGAKRARNIYWAHSLQSLWPLLRRATVRAIRWGIMIDSVRRWFF
jgi:hypothetical protein